MSPCAVRITPARPARPGSSASTLKNGADESVEAKNSARPRRRFCTVRIHLPAAAAIALALAGCSSAPPEYQPPPGSLVAGTAQATVNGQDAGTTDAVQCTATGPLTTITTGDDAGASPRW